MGNSSNTQTLRSNIFYNNISTNLKLCSYNPEFIKNLKKSFYKKQVFLIESYISTDSNSLELYLFLFFRTRKIINYQNQLLNSRVVKRKFDYLSLLQIFQNKKLKNLKLKIFVLNKTDIFKKKKSQITVRLYKSLKSFKFKLFTKNLNLFFDFIKLSTLFLLKKINSSVILVLLSSLFCYLRKRAHTTFLFFLKSYFLQLIDIKNSVFKGFKFLIFGKLSGKTRADFKRVQVGSVSIQSIKDNIDYSKTHVYTRYGVFGFRLWTSLSNLA